MVSNRMLPTRRILYVGCGMAGKLYSVTSALERCGQRLPSSEWGFREAFQRFTLTRGERPVVELLVRISDRRASLAEYDPMTLQDVRIRDEIDEIARADGLVFVLDSRLGREEANVRAAWQLRRDLSTRGVDALTKPIVFQANKRDLSDIVTMEWVRNNFLADRCAYIESSALNHVGTLEALREVLRLTGAID